MDDISKMRLKVIGRPITPDVLDLYAEQLQELAAMMRSGDVAVRENSFLSHRHCGDGDDRVIEVCLNYGLPRSLH